MINRFQPLVALTTVSSMLDFVYINWTCPNRLAEECTCRFLRLTTFYKPKRTTLLQFRNLSQTNLNIWNPSYHKENPPAHCIIFHKWANVNVDFHLSNEVHDLISFIAAAFQNCMLMPSRSATSPRLSRPPPYFLQLCACSELQPSLRTTDPAPRQTLS